LAQTLSPGLKAVTSEPTEMMVDDMSDVGRTFSFTLIEWV
jgi:hypothetical protein